MTISPKVVSTPPRHHFKHSTPVASSQDSTCDKVGVQRVQQIDMFGVNIPSSEEHAKMLGQYLINRQMKQHIQATMGGGLQPKKYYTRRPL